MPLLSVKPNRVVKYHYWFDKARDMETVIPLSEYEQQHFLLDVSGLSTGIHFLYYRVQDSIGSWSPLYGHLFFVNPLYVDCGIDVKQLEYWIDDNFKELSIVPIDGDQSVFEVEDLSLIQGFHTLYYRIKDSMGNYSTTHSWLFFKNELKATTISWCKYWWNDDFDKTTIVFNDSDSSVFSFCQELIVPEYARNSEYSSNTIAKLNIIFGDDLGHVSNVEEFEIRYPDIVPPKSSIKIDRVQTNIIVLSWSANEDSIQDYNIYYAEEDQPYVLWLPNTKSQTASFRGQTGKTYRFTVTSRDKAGNIEMLDENKYAIVQLANSH